MREEEHRSRLVIFTVGHSNVPVEDLVGLLKTNDIQLLVDVRSVPFSKHASQFNRDNIKWELRNQQIEYLFMGEELGGRPRGSDFYSVDGTISYARVAQSQRFLAGIEKLISEATELRVAIMCSEENPGKCHRSKLIAAVLRERGIEVLHIRRNGETQNDEALGYEISRGQMKLFDNEEGVL